MDKLIEILTDIDSRYDYSTETDLIDGGKFDSMSILTLVASLEDEFDVEITPAELISSNFNSAKAMWAMIERLSEE